jgi:hypothetical protein
MCAPAEAGSGSADKYTLLHNIMLATEPPNECTVAVNSQPESSLGLLLLILDYRP